jgi:hypothetical protein
MHSLQKLSADIQSMKKSEEEKQTKVVRPVFTWQHVFDKSILLNLSEVPKEQEQVLYPLIRSSNIELCRNRACRSIIRGICSGQTDLAKVLYQLYLYLWKCDLHETRALLNAIGKSEDGQIWGGKGFFFPNFFTTADADINSYIPVVEYLVKDVIAVLKTASYHVTFKEAIKFLQEPWQELKDALDNSGDNMGLYYGSVLEMHSLWIILREGHTYTSWEELLLEYLKAVSDNFTKGITDEAFAVVQALENGIEVSAAHAAAKTKST